MPRPPSLDPAPGAGSGPDPRDPASRPLIMDAVDLLAIHIKDVHAVLAGEGDPLSVRRPGGKRVVLGELREALQTATVCADDPQVPRRSVGPGDTGSQKAKVLP